MNRWNDTNFDESDFNDLIFKFEKIDYFDSDRGFDKNEKNYAIIEHVDRHVYYKNVFVFVDKLKKLKRNSFDHKIREFVVDCLRDDAFI